MAVDLQDIESGEVVSISAEVDSGTAMVMTSMESTPPPPLTPPFWSLFEKTREIP